VLNSHFGAVAAQAASPGRAPIAVLPWGRHRRVQPLLLDAGMKKLAQTDTMATAPEA